MTGTGMASVQDRTIRGSLLEPEQARQLGHRLQAPSGTAEITVAVKKSGDRCNRESCGAGGCDPAHGVFDRHTGRRGETALYRR